MSASFRLPALTEREIVVSAAEHAHEVARRMRPRLALDSDLCCSCRKEMAEPEWMFIPEYGFGCPGCWHAWWHDPAEGVPRGGACPGCKKHPR